MWIATVRIRASNLRVWDIITPNMEKKPQQLIEPERPSTRAIHTARAGGNIQAVKSAMEIYNLDKEVYKIDLADFERQAKALSDPTTFLQDTISAHNITYLRTLSHTHGTYYKHSKRSWLPVTQHRNTRSFMPIGKYAKVLETRIWKPGWTNRTVYTLKH